MDAGVRATLGARKRGQDQKCMLYETRCIYVYTCIQMCTYAYMYTYLVTHTHIHCCVYIQRCNVCIWIQCKQTCTPVHRCIHIYVRMEQNHARIYVYIYIYEPSAIFSEPKRIYLCCLRFWDSPSFYSVLAVSFSCSTTLVLERPSPAAGWIFVLW